MRRWIVSVSILFILTGTARSQDQVRLDLVTYKQLGNEIKKLHGKVILVDFWADFCRPCKEKFPHVMELHRKYAKDGLTVVSVSIDDVTDPDVRERVKMFLRQQGADCKNLLLAEKPETWIEKLHMNSVPSMFLFDREGRLINRWTGGEIELNSIEKRISQLLAEDRHEQN
jgi:thiol-disulfide isomerase/thioredoxin